MVGGKADEGRCTTPFPLAQGAQETAEQVVLVQTLTQSCSLFSLFLVAAQAVRQHQPIWGVAA